VCPSRITGMRQEDSSWSASIAVVGRISFSKAISCAYMVVYRCQVVLFAKGLVCAVRAHGIGLQYVAN
jgi:hypothetical protein